MGSNAFRETQAKINEGVPVVINLGLDGSPDKVYRGTLAQARERRYETYRKAIKDLFEPELTAHLYTLDDIEPTLVVHGRFSFLAAHTDLFWEMLKKADQDCAAIYYPLDRVGYLYGPNAEAWGNFDINQMKGVSCIPSTSPSGLA